MTQDLKLLPEWSKQEAVLLAWPDRQTDWRPWLTEVQDVYLTIIEAINKLDIPVVLLVRSEELSECQIRLQRMNKVLLVKADYNDTWVRDYGFLTLANNQGCYPIEFAFNGWGQKFDARKDNGINQKVLSQLCQQAIQSIDLVVEGGALEIDQHGTLLSTELCLTNPKRNDAMPITDYIQAFKRNLGAIKSIILKHGHLEGDDTDGHIDTLVRFTPESGLVIQSAFNRPDDSHFDSLRALVEECREALPEHKIFELPLPKMFNLDGERLPASYANYLICNQHILCPVYQQPEDQLALAVIQNAYPSFKIITINCQPLVQQFGSLHCISMQVPTGVLKPEVLKTAQSGVNVYA